ncbi:MAG: hypothetical protein RMZ69_02875 [Nostoc sp. ChiQUE01a]|uniref:hypothetical protein n=1 Tax=Nostoc sp. CCY 9925 TaxID=3103865 RepID=UPI002ADC6BA2|nr:hypothetical protein [Nostoc sp. ChiQUE01a]
MLAIDIWIINYQSYSVVRWTLRIIEEGSVWTTCAERTRVRLVEKPRYAKQSAEEQI